MNEKPEWMISEKALGMILQRLVNQNLSYSLIGKLAIELAQMTKETNNKP